MGQRQAGAAVLIKGGDPPMRHLAAILCFAVMSSCAPAAAADRDHPAVVELFQSQGCSSCPPANANLNAIADRPELLPLSFAVTYWDRLGWRDTFAQPAFTDRQWDYAHAGRRGEVSTPQMIVNGRGVLVGSSRGKLEAAIRAFDRGTAGPAITRAGNRVTIGRATATAPATVWLVYFDPRVQQVAIRAGENGGRTLPHRNIVRTLRRLGDWTGAALTAEVPRAADAAWRGAILLQSGKGGAIIAASRI
jgi:hypothetical protein